MSAPATTTHGRTWAIRLNRAVYWLSRRWLWVVLFTVSIWVGLPWLAPLFMALGWETAGKAIYLLYTFQCHQMPQRSFFLFGSKPMLSLSEIQTIWQNTNDPIILRQFIGNAASGWKVAWSDRMVYMYTSIIFWGTLYWPFRKRLPTLPIWGLGLFLLPMALDGVTHMISDLVGGIGLGFRETNPWLATLTNHTFADTFYAGDALGSFNSWIRLLTGILFGLGVVWFFFPLLQQEFSQTARQIKTKFNKANLTL